MKGEFVAGVVFGARGAEWRDSNIECGKVFEGGLGLLCGDGSSLSYSLLKTPNIFHPHGFLDTPIVVSSFYPKRPMRVQGL